MDGWTSRKRGLEGFTARGHAKTGWAQRVAGSEGGRLCCSLGIVI